MLKFEKIQVDMAREEKLKGFEEIYRTQVPGGWLVALKQGATEQLGGVCFVPDPDHEWDLSANS
jgi:hypothetical protein